MRGLDRRIKNVEKLLSLGEKPKTINIIFFADRLPADMIQGNRTIHFVKYDERIKEWETLANESALSKRN